MATRTRWLALWGLAILGLAAALRALQSDPVLPEDPPEAEASVHPQPSPEPPSEPGASRVVLRRPQPAGEAGPDGAFVMAAITLDGRGVLELELSAYDPELGAQGVDDPLPPTLVACVDDVLWDLDWPVREEGVRFALTTPFEPAD